MPSQSCTILVCVILLSSAVLSTSAFQENGSPFVGAIIPSSEEETVEGSFVNLPEVVLMAPVGRLPVFSRLSLRDYHDINGHYPLLDGVSSSVEEAFHPYRFICSPGEGTYFVTSDDGLSGMHGERIESGRQLIELHFQPPPPNDRERRFTPSTNLGKLMSFPLVIEQGEANTGYAAYIARPPALGGHLSCGVSSVQQLLPLEGVSPKDMRRVQPSGANLLLTVGMESIGVRLNSSGNLLSGRWLVGETQGGVSGRLWQSYDDIDFDVAYWVSLTGLPVISNATAVLIAGEHSWTGTLLESKSGRPVAHFTEVSLSREGGALNVAIKGKLPADPKLGIDFDMTIGCQLFANRLGFGTSEMHWRGNRYGGACQLAVVPEQSISILGVPSEIQEKRRQMDLEWKRRIGAW